MLKKGFLASILAGALALVGCSSNLNNIDEARTPPKELPIATIVFRDFGTVEVELYPHIAPNTVNNFISLANSGFYDGLTFHRIIKDFMIQGGDPDGTGMGGPGYSIKGEFANNKFKNDLAHTEGVISMARSQSKNSAGSQFFIVTKDSPHLDGQYASFGKVISGMDIIHKIENVETDSNDKPIKDVLIQSIKVDTKGVDYKEPDKM
ncbi:peptidylprolyl isomerase [Romboutsia ilealis]|uniref:Peptidyl-prolyl cis-trans isomerase n=1 Tax=Romboutsia faecis TaxID=2764597 RepID=A0ABR7JLA9_9FIRM|nr:peptidylprolyl isomerase [Romboutsia faecis]MBC5995712.1 peptidylprolyl isomerase [Romboutsia faecis]MRN23913.1 peptidylprolyl isomerase [Romboutsia ilealis]